MTEMVYTRRRQKVSRLADGEYRGYHYYVLSFGTHPCAYVDIGDTGVDINAIECHGGITYSREYLATVEHESGFIGWDYAHCYDYNGDIPEMTAHCKKWTTAEIVDECKSVIDQICSKRGGRR